MASPLQNNRLAQVGFVCRDIEKTKREFAEFLGLPVPETVGCGDYRVTQTEFKGVAAPDANCVLAFFNLPNVQLELIQPNDASSVWHDDLEKNGEGFHHLAFNADGMQKHITAMAGAGLELVQKGEYGSGDGRYAYFKGGLLGTTIELLESDHK